ncbi:MAG TPA: hypothetical protein VG708_13735 [Mycobacteriales bacterium]|nr:hypothetical protein [Mycobacteriales bacterium]
MTISAGAEAARAAHHTLEPMHAVSYFASEHGLHYADLGITGGMRGYFASRSAALGRVPAEVVVATFYNFSPALIAKAIPSVWEVTSPEAVLEARLAATDATYRRVLGDDVLRSDEMAEAAELAKTATAALSPIGRPLYAGHAALPWPDAPHLRLFHAVTLLREHRGDGHIAALLLAGLDAVETLVSYVPVGKGLPEGVLRTTRGWSEPEWDAAVARLRDRGIIDDSGGLTPAGQQQRDTIEAQTDEAAAAAYLHLGPDGTKRLRDLVRPWKQAMNASIVDGLR